MSVEESILSIITKNVINDYYTAGIKTEVVIDTLITPVIVDIVAGQLKGSNNLKYITKEFPLVKEAVKDKLEKMKQKKNETEENKSKKASYSNTKADYILSDDKFIYIVELKTSSDSINDEQINAYANYINRISGSGSGSDEMLEEFTAVFNKYSSSGIKDDEFLENYKNPEKQEQYKLTEIIAKVEKKNNNSQKTSSKKYYKQATQIKDNGLEKWEGKGVKLIYIIPHEEKVLKDKIIEKLGEEKVSFVYLDKIGGVSGKDNDESKEDDTVSEEDRKQYYDWVRKSILKPIFNKSDPKQSQV